MDSFTNQPPAWEGSQRYAHDRWPDSVIQACLCKTNEQFEQLKSSLRAHLDKDGMLAQKNTPQGLSRRITSSIETFIAATPNVHEWGDAPPSDITPTMITEAVSSLARKLRNNAVSNQSRERRSEQSTYQDEATAARASKRQKKGPISQEVAHATYTRVRPPLSSMLLVVVNHASLQNHIIPFVDLVRRDDINTIGLEPDVFDGDGILKILRTQCRRCGFDSNQHAFYWNDRGRPFAIDNGRALHAAITTQLAHMIDEHIRILFTHRSERDGWIQRSESVDF